MSMPPTLTLPACGEFAVHDALPDAPVRCTALLVPGFTGSKEDFIALLEPLAAAGIRAVAVDGRGQYETDGPREESAYAQDELARDVLAQAAALAGPGGGQVHVLGHSLGGLIVRAAALLDPGVFASLTLMSSGPAAIAAPQRDRTKVLIDALAVLSMESVWQAMRELDPPEAVDAATPPALRDFLHRRWLDTVPEQLMATGRQLNREPDRVAELAAVALPTHVVSGELDYAWPVPWIDDMAERLGAHRTVITGAAHSPNAEQPLPTARALAAFWDGVGW
jgi:pimeloyl-ACP methyl ester carboxylesterase